MSRLIDLLTRKVPRKLSLSLQSESETDLSVENFQKSFSSSDKDYFQDTLRRNPSLDYNFDSKNNLYPSGVTSLDIKDKEVYPPNLEQLIQESVSRSTARLLTKNALKYLDKDIEVKKGEGVSHQFTLRSPKIQETPSVPRLKNDFHLESVQNLEEGPILGSIGPLSVDPELSSFKVQNLTYEMYKLFDNIKSFEMDSCQTNKLEYDFGNEISEDPLPPDDNQGSIKSGNLTESGSLLVEPQDEESLFESQMRSKSLGSLTNFLPRDSKKSSDYNPNLFDQSNTLDYSRKHYLTENFSTDNNSFGTNSYKSTDLGNKDSFESKVYDNEYRIEKLNLQQNYDEKIDYLTFNTAKSDSKSVDGRCLSNYTCFNRVDSEESKLVSSESLVTGKESIKTPLEFPKPSKNLQSYDSEKTLDHLKQTKNSYFSNLENFNPPYVTRVYAPLERLYLPKRRAVVIGCNYLGNPDAQLRGSCNDAFVFAQVLVTRFNFDPKNVILLLDSNPSPAYTRNLSQNFNNKKSDMDFSLNLSRVRTNHVERNVYPTKKTSMFGRHLVERNLKHLTLNENLCLDSTVSPAPTEMHPTRGNVFRSLKWLNFSSAPGDLSVVFFSGHSVQVDDLSGYEGDGFDEALVPMDFEANGLVTCNDLKCLFQSIGATCRLNAFFDTCNLQTVVGGSSKSGPVKGSKMKGIWPFSEPTGKLESFECSETVYKDSKMMNQMTRVKYLPTLQVDSLGSLSDVQLCLDSTHGVVNYVVLSSSNVKSVSVECLFKPLNLDTLTGLNYPVNNQQQMVRDDEVVVHGAFTYALLLTLLYDKSDRRAGLGVDEVVEGVNKKLTQLKKLRLPKLNQQCEVLFYHSSNLAKNAFLFPLQFTPCNFTKYSSTPYGYLLPNDAWMFMVHYGRRKAKEQQEKFERMKTDLITLTNLNNKMFNLNTARTNVLTPTSNQNTLRTSQNVSAVGSNTTPNIRVNNLEVTVKPFVVNGDVQQPQTSRSLTNNLSSRVFTRNPNVVGRMSSRSKTAIMNNLTASTTNESVKNLVYLKYNNPLHSHNWYGGVTVSVPYNSFEGGFYNENNKYWNVYGQDQFGNDNLNHLNQFQVGKNWNVDQLYTLEHQYYGKFNSMPLYEPITPAMLKQLPTRKSFTVLQQ